ncbi:hypothetical protein [Streptomyces roseoverticillatus]|uniref:hypothetical protein n=1 Tax=Streptomyces roseoverticillatus TaxID=66429 RepID=UPI0006931DFD|nr:hypothetical protein [Streptomyces roseoverticillatus]
MGNKSWKLMQDGTVVGRLLLLEVDQPWFICRFSPAEHWESVCEFFEEQSCAMKSGDPEMIAVSMRKVRSMELRLLPEVPAGEEIEPIMIHVEGETAKFRT